MRLTLRTLLAYLDDTLEPEQAKSIGQKVMESPVAQELVERIKRVTRRRSLANPPIHGDTSLHDPNTVAEYIDSTLAADELSQVEQTCLDDDVYLAEVAACHQILTLMLSEPARVPPPARQRMYRLVHGHESSPYRQPPAYFPEVRRNGRAKEHDEARSERFVIYLTASLLLALGLAVSVALAWPRSLPTRSQSNVAVAFAPPVIVDKGSAKSGDAEKPGAAVAAPSANDKPKRLMPEPTLPAAAVAEPAKKPIDRVPIVAASSERREVGTFVSALSVLVAQREANDAWQAVRMNGRVAAGDRLMALPGFRSEVKLDGGVQVMLWGNVLEFLPWLSALESMVTMHVPPARLDADLTLDHGRVVITNVKDGSPVRVRLRFRGEVWDVTMAPRAELLIDGLISFEPGVRFAKGGGGDSPFAQLFVGVTRGKATLQIRDLAPIELGAPPGPALIGWDNKTRLKEPLSLIQPLPQWTTEIGTKAPVPEIKAAMSRLQDRLVQDRASVELALTELSQDAKPYAQAYAAYALPAIDVIAPVVDALDDLLKPHMRGAAILSLRHWITRRPDNALTLHKLLVENKKYGDTQADSVLQLLHSFSQQDVTAATTYEQLFALLNDEKLSIRELAYWHLGQLDPEGLKLSMYNPTLTDGREAAIGRWRKRLTDGKLPPKPPKAANGSADKTK